MNKKQISGALFFLLFILSASFVFAENYDNNYKVRVGLYYASTAKTEYNLNIKQPYLQNNHHKVLLGTAAVSSVEYQNIVLGNGYFTEEEAKKKTAFSGGFVCYQNGMYYEAAETSTVYWKVAKAVVVKGNGQTLFAYIPQKGIALGCQTGVFSIGNKTYRGELELIEYTGRLTAINYVGLQEYLYGVLPKEIPPSWEIEALKAQAVVSRNFTLTNMGKFQKYGFDLDTTTTSQVYGGYGAEKPRTNQAVDETQGQLAYYNGEVASLFFHSESGGRTESSENIWGMRKPYLIGVNDPYSSSGQYANWTYTITKDKLQTLMKNSGRSVGEITFLSIDEKTENGRAKKMTVHGTNGSKTFVKEEFRRMIGSTVLKSMYFDLSKQQAVETKSEMDLIFDDLTEFIDNYQGKVSTNKNSIQNASGEQFVFYGHGYGHGVGMSQTGANNMGKEGKNYREIIAYYFPGVFVQ